MAVNLSGSSTGVRYVVNDHLNSASVVANSSGTVLERDSYNAWGMRRVASTWAEDADCAQTSVLSRGFTGHEHLDAMCLINMNARIYDPVIGRFTTADSMIPALYDGQSLNRYAYVGNGPLSATDPTGHSWLSRLLATLGLTSSAMDGLSSSDGIETVTVTGIRESTTSFDGAIRLSSSSSALREATAAAESGISIDSDIKETVVVKGIRPKVKVSLGTPVKTNSSYDFGQCQTALNYSNRSMSGVYRAWAAWGTLDKAAKGTSIPTSLLAAIGVRETDFRNIQEINGSGKGVFQLTNQPNVTSEQAYDLEFSSVYAANMLASNMGILSSKFPFFTSDQLLQATADSYNFGIKNISGNTDTMDVGSTGNNYGSSVIGLMSCF